MLFITIKFLHLITLTCLLGASLTKNVLVSRQTLSPEQAKGCTIADRVSGAAAGLSVLSGIALIYLSEKGTSFYFQNALFWTKLFTLLVASVLVIRTKIFFKKCAATTTPKPMAIGWNIRAILRFDFVSLLVILFLAILLTSGYSLRL